jgi:non-specific serine/threonine protein kinase
MEQIIGRSILVGSGGLATAGRGVEIDRHRLGHELKCLKAAEALAARDGLSFAEAMRLLAGAAISADSPDIGTPSWSEVTAGPWLPRTLHALRYR